MTVLPAADLGRVDGNGGNGDGRVGCWSAVCAGFKSLLDGLHGFIQCRLHASDESGRGGEA